MVCFLPPSSAAMASTIDTAIDWRVAPNMLDNVALMAVEDVQGN